MGNTIPGILPTPSARRTERVLAGGLLVLLITYALGTVVETTLPVVYLAGVLAVHLAIVVGALFPLSILAHAVVGRFRSTTVCPSRLEIGVAAVSLCAFIAALGIGAVPAADDASTPLAGIALGGLLVLAGLVAGGSA